MALHQTLHIIIPATSLRRSSCYWALISIIIISICRLSSLICILRLGSHRALLLRRVILMLFLISSIILFIFWGVSYFGSGHTTTHATSSHIVFIRWGISIVLIFRWWILVIIYIISFWLRRASLYLSTSHTTICLGLLCRLSLILKIIVL